MNNTDNLQTALDILEFYISEYDRPTAGSHMEILCCAREELKILEVEE